MADTPIDEGDSTAGPEADDRRTTTAPATDDRFVVPLRGVDVDPETRCAHWDAPVDVVALRFGCCEAYYPCDACHDAAADHEPEPWPRARFDEPAVLCGGCGATLTATAYLDGVGEGQSPSGNRASPGDGEALCASSSRTQSDDSRAKPDDDACPECGAAFNPSCRAHRDRYFEV